MKLFKSLLKWLSLSENRTPSNENSHTSNSQIKIEEVNSNSTITATTLIALLSNNSLSSKEAKKLLSNIKSNKKAVSSLVSFEGKAIDDYSINDFHNDFDADDHFLVKPITNSEIYHFLRNPKDEDQQYLIKRFDLLICILTEYIESIKVSFYRNIRFFFRKIMQLFFKNLDDYHNELLINSGYTLNKLFIHSVIQENYEDSRNKKIDRRIRRNN